jgi:4-amino-4-deoxy-L-arabinose transferase-like glycosyltransferase
VLTPSHALLSAVLAAYLIGSLAGLDVYPTVGQDEPWIASAPYKLATEGVLGTDLFAGLAGMERHHYQHMPVYPILEAAVFRVAGVGVSQMRLLSVIFGLLLLVASFCVGRLIGDDRVGLVAVLLLVLLRLGGGDDVTGILLLDRARVNRYDIAVPVFGLLAFAAYVRATSSRRRWDWAWVGFSSALAGLSHLYGMFWAVVLGGLCFWRGGRHAFRTSDIWLAGLGFAVAVAPWILYILTGWTDYVGQMRTVADRFDVLSPAFYLSNAMFGDGPISLRWLLETIRALPFDRIGAWTALIGVPAAAATMLQTEPRPESAARTFAWAAIGQLLLFVVLLRVKTVSYMIALWPLGALCLAWLGVRLWDRRRGWLRVALALLAAAIAIEGGARILHARAVASRMTPYHWYTAQVAGCIPAGSLALGLQHYWLGLRQFPYRTWLLPLYRTNPRFTDEPVRFDVAIEQIDPDVILIDRHMRDLFAQTSDPDDPLHRIGDEFAAFTARHPLTPACVVRDRTYGEMQVYHVR